MNLSAHEVKKAALWRISMDVPLEQLKDTAVNGHVVASIAFWINDVPAIQS